MKSAQNDDFIIRIPRKLFNRDIKELLSKINFKSIESKSKASQKEIDKFLLQVKKERGVVVKGLLERVKLKV